MILIIWYSISFKSTHFMNHIFGPFLLEFNIFRFRPLFSEQSRNLFRWSMLGNIGGGSSCNFFLQSWATLVSPRLYLNLKMKNYLNVNYLFQKWKHVTNPKVFSYFLLLIDSQYLILSLGSFLCYSMKVPRHFFWTSSNKFHTLPNFWPELLLFYYQLVCILWN